MSFEPFTIDERIERARTLPARVYADPAVFEHQRDALFARSWQFVGSTEDLSVPGATLPFTLLPGCLDEPLVLTRDHDDQIRCLSNVCTHRGALVCEHAGVERTLTCRYHGRRFGLDGGCKFMPEFEKVEGFPAPSDDLPAVQFGTWGKFIFASLDPREPLDACLGAMRDRHEWLDLSGVRCDATRSRDYLVKCNWALYCDNYLEGFHVPFVHPSLSEFLDYGAYVTETHGSSVLQVGVAKGAEHCFDIPAGAPDHGKNIAGYYWWLFPNTMINLYPWGVSVNIVEPLGVALTRVRFLSYVCDESKIAHGAGADLDRVEREDEAIVESVQIGAKSRLYDRGRYSPEREQGVHQFHRLMSQWLCG